MQDQTRPAVDPLERTPLHALHLARGARMVPFAGYEMPVQYAAGVLKEHLHTRASAGLFDVSHMGQIELRARSGDVADAARALERLVPQDVVGLADGRQRYAQFTTGTGGIRDDLMVANRGDHLFLVVNAACKAADIAHLEDQLSDVCEIVPLPGRALLALQGPCAAEVLARFAPEVAAMRFMDVRAIAIDGAVCVVSRSGYTGEDGYEISIPSDDCERIAAHLLDDPAVLPIGLGARDSLRLEAGLCLYGHDLTTQTTPVEAALSWSIQKSRRAGGARAGGFPGADVILPQLSDGAARIRVGLAPEGRAPVREGAALFSDASSTPPIGRVTSGGFGPSANAPVAMGTVATAHGAAGGTVFADLRGSRVPMRVVTLPFVAHTYLR